MAGFAEEDDFFDIGGLEDFVDFREVLVVGFISATQDNDNVVVGKGINSYPGRRSVGGKIIVIIFNAFKLTDEFETVGQAVKTR